MHTHNIDCNYIADNINIEVDFIVEITSPIEPTTHKYATRYELRGQECCTQSRKYWWIWWNINRDATGIVHTTSMQRGLLESKYRLKIKLTNKQKTPKAVPWNITNQNHRHSTYIWYCIALDGTYRGWAQHGKMLIRFELEWHGSAIWSIRMHVCMCVELNKMKFKREN